MQKKTLGELAKYVDGKVIGDSNVIIKSASTLGRAGVGDISFLANVRYKKQLLQTKASAVIVDKETPNVSAPLLIAEDPYYAFMQIMVLLHGHRRHKKVGRAAVTLKDFEFAYDRDFGSISPKSTRITKLIEAAIAAAAAPIRCSTLTVRTLATA